MREEVFQHRLQELANLSGVELTYHTVTMKTRTYENQVNNKRVYDIFAKNAHTEWQTIFTGTQYQSSRFVQACITLLEIRNNAKNKS